MNELILGQWNVICDQCGVKRKSGQVIERWDGRIVCRPDVRPGCYETRHPQDFVRTVVDDQSVPFTRPEPTDQFVSVTYIAETVGTQERSKPSGTFNNDL
jgi:hypothetical protein